MHKWGYIGIILLCIMLIGCSEDVPNEQETVAEVENDEHVEEDNEEDNEEDRRRGFGEHFIEIEDNVVYINESDELFVYNHETEKEFLVHEDVIQFDLIDHYVYYLAEDGMTSELDLPLQTIHRTDIQTEKDEIMFAATEEDGGYMSPRAFYVNENGHIAVQQEIGFFYSNYWYDYFVTDANFSTKRPIITFEDEYDYVLNEIKWQENDIFLLVDRVGSVGDDHHVQIELHSFSMSDGPRVLHENALPLTVDEYTELHDYSVYISLENDILYLRAVDEDVEKIVYEIDLTEQQIINQYR